MATTTSHPPFTRTLKTALPDRPTAFGMSTTTTQQQRDAQRADRERERLERERLERESASQLDQLTQEQREEIDEA
ncbi:MAG: hypothetical protein LQ340_004238, partial [Diploschistes diacapsis]